VEANAKDYLVQVGKVVDLSRAEVVRNGDWFSAMSFLDILEMCSKVTIAQLLTREDFAKRLKAEQAIYLHECLYPVMQGWDSVEIRADVELGGTEQLYSFMLARDLQRAEGLSQQIGVMTPILVGLDGVRRMGKSLGNYIGINESPYDMMKKFMQIPDAVMRMYFELLTDIPLDRVNELLAGHPKAAKQALATAVIGEYHSADAAREAAAKWEREVSGGELPADIPDGALHRSQLTDGRMQAASLLKELGLVPSTSEAMRVINGGGAYYYSGSERRKIEDRKEWIAIAEGGIVGVGKKQIRRVKLVDG
jgi:tyrosyl-tRNA synthetase